MDPLQIPGEEGVVAFKQQPLYLQACLADAKKLCGEPERASETSSCCCLPRVDASSDPQSMQFLKGSNALPLPYLCGEEASSAVPSIHHDFHPCLQMHNCEAGRGSNRLHVTMINRGSNCLHVNKTI
eukprot:1159090-Pelagomonas_calceolata.AAC.4